MLNNVIVDTSSIYSEYEKRLVSILYLVADNVYEVGNILLQTVEIQATKVKDDCEIICKAGATVKPVYGAPLIPPHFTSGFKHGSQKSTIFVGHSVANNLVDEVVFTKKGWVKKAYIASQGLTSKTCLLMLSVAGLEVILPNTLIENRSIEELTLVKEKLNEERQQYLISISDLAAETYERVISNEYEDIVAWARNEANVKILPRAMTLQSSLKKLDNNVLRRLGVDFVKDGIPAIGMALTEDGVSKGLNVAAVEFLKILSGGLAKSIEQRRVPEVNYGIRVAELSKKI